MALSPGDKLGPYECIALTGKGGMGEVWKAHDPRLKRDVAIKVSAAEFSERFEREAKAIAALSHSNICTLHDVGPNYLVMEYIEGTPLKGPLPVEQALKYAAQICEHSTPEGMLTAGSDSAPLKIRNQTLRPRVLIDRSSVEVFAEDGQVTFSSSTRRNWPWPQSKTL